MSSQQLQSLAVSELDEDINGPLLVVLVLPDTNFTGTTDAYKGARQFVRKSGGSSE